MKNTSLPLVSICIPTYNGEKYLAQTLDSAINQTYKNIEIIINDDGSTDSTLLICKQYAAKDNRISVFSNKQNMGLVENWKECIKKSNSDWVKFLFQDDLYDNDCVEKCINAALLHNVNVVISNRKYIFEEGVSLNTVEGYTKKLPKTHLIFENNVITSPTQTAEKVYKIPFKNCIGEPPTYLFNKKVYNESDMVIDFRQLVDYIFILNTILVHDFVFLSDELVKFRVHGNSESMKNALNSKKNYINHLYITIYEKLLICFQIENNPNFKVLKDCFLPKELQKIKKWFVVRSYYKYGFVQAAEFYKTCKINDYLHDFQLQKYSKSKYLQLKLKYIKTRKKFKL